MILEILNLIFFSASTFLKLYKVSKIFVIIEKVARRLDFP